ncbi:MAG: hypothetical protein JZU65_12890, partial [Chlorobium sp.]|nr:hypothetical protein [Chlorobium sp.]
MKNYYSTTELAGLPGMPGTDRAIRDLSDREAWPNQKRAGRGGGKEYALSALPEATQRHLTKSALSRATKEQPVAKVTAPVPAIIKQLPAATELTAHQNKIMNARVWLMKAIEGDMAIGHRLQQALVYIVEQIAQGMQPFAGQAELANDRKRKDGATLSERSLMR